MNISKQEAEESLTQIAGVTQKTRQAMGYSGGYILMIWGVIWAIGFSGVQFFQPYLGWIWLVLDSIGFIATWLCIRQSASKFSNPGGWRIGLSWMILFGYMVVWEFLLHPVGRSSLAFYSTVCMCAYVMMGLWLSTFFLWLGLIVTAMTVVGFYLVPAWFALWMAITGGGALFLSGLYICKFWK